MACEYCGMEYSFYFGCQFHKKDCPALKNEKDECKGTIMEANEDGRCKSNREEKGQSEGVEAH